MRKFPLIVREFIRKAFLDLVRFEEASFCPVVELTLFKVIFVEVAEERIGVVEDRDLLQNGLIVIVESILCKVWMSLEHKGSSYVATKNRILSNKTSKIAKHQEWTHEHDYEHGTNDSTKDDLVTLFIRRP